ncbi:MAG: hypothetical protein P8129_21095, partial [Anaerolineae bacterium]
MPAGRNPVLVLQPQVARPAGQLQDAGPVGKLEPVKEPALPAIVVGAEPLVELDAGIEVARRPVLVGHERFVCKIRDFAHGI